MGTLRIAMNQSNEDVNTPYAHKFISNTGIYMC